MKAAGNFWRKKEIGTGALLFAAALGVMARFFVMTLGYNYDFDSYKIVGEIVSRGGSVYAETTRYNYGFLFFLIQGLGYKLTLLIRPDAVDTIYRVYIVSVLTLADVGITSWLSKKASPRLGLLFFLNPLSILITGFHNQFDNCAVLFALLASDFVDDSSEDLTKRDLLAILFLTLSLITKHILFVFFAWIFFRGRKQRPGKRLAYTFLPAILFLLSFLPFLIGNPAVLNGIIGNVFSYRSYNNYPFFRPLFLLVHVPERAYFYLYILIMLAVGFLLRGKDFTDLLLCYFAAMVAFSSAIANQYLVIPLIALVLCEKKVYLFLYETVGLVYCLFNANELHLINRALLRFPGAAPLWNFLAEEGGWLVVFMAWILAAFVLREVCGEIRRPGKGRPEAGRKRAGG